MVKEQEASVLRHRLRDEVERLAVVVRLAVEKRERDDAALGIDPRLEELGRRRCLDALHRARAVREERRGDPEHGCLRMGVAVHLRALEVVFEVVALAGAHAHAGDVAPLVHASAEREVRAARGGTVLRAVEPSAPHTHEIRIREHCGARGLAPVARIVRTIYKLAPESVLALVLEKRLHHQEIAFHDARTVRAVLRQLVEEERHPRRHPAVAAPPDERHVRRMVEEALRGSVLELEPVEVEDHLRRRALDVLSVARRAVRLALERGDHVHVVDPEARLHRKPLRVVLALDVRRRTLALLERRLAWLAPLRVGVHEPNVEATTIFVLEVYLQRQRTENGVIDVSRTRTHLVLLAARQEVVEQTHESLLAVFVAGQARALYRVHP